MNNLKLLLLNNLNLKMDYSKFVIIKSNNNKDKGNKVSLIKFILIKNVFTITKHLKNN